MSRFSLKSALLTVALLALPVFGYLFWPAAPATLSLLTKDYQETGTEVKQDFQSLPTLPLTEEKDSFTLTDTTPDGLDIRFANQSEDTLKNPTPKLSLSFPKDYSKPMEVRLDDQRTVTITDLAGKNDYTTSTLSPDEVQSEENLPFFQKLFGKKKALSQNYLRYTSKDERKSLLYAYQKDQGTGEKKLKHWTLYREGNGVEQESYQINNAKVRVNGEGVAEVFYYTEQDLKNDQAAAGVDENLMERAQRTLAKEMGEDLLSGNHTPDFTIPKPYYIDKGGEKHEAEWKWSEENKTLSVSFSPESYPVALDPTLSFTAPGVSSNSGVVITSDGTGATSFGYTMVAGDFNTDGRMDLAVSAENYAAAGRVYIFYNDGVYPDTSASADVTISAVASSGDLFGQSLAAGDFNSDGRTDLAVGTYHNVVNIFYNDGSYPGAAASADIIITGEASSEFGHWLTAADFNGDGRMDLAASAWTYSSNTGRTYVFYNDGTSLGTTVCTTGCLAANADAIMTGETAGDYFGRSIASGDWNADGKSDLAVGANGYSSSFGRAYLFYGGSIATEAASGADVILTGIAAGNFGASFAAGDWNADGLTDLAVGANTVGSSVGRVYLFYGGSITTETASGADVTMSNGTSTGYFGGSLASGDMNADGRADLIVGATDFSTGTGAVFIFYNDGSLPTNANVADVTISGAGIGTGSGFGYSLATADFNSDGRVDLATSASGYNPGRAYIFFSQNGLVNTNQTIVGAASGDAFGSAVVSGDFNADGRTDLAVGAKSYNPGGASNTGRVYVFYGDGQLPAGAGSADAIMTGEASSNYFGTSLAAGDWNADGKTDLAVGARGYTSNTGRTYVFNGGSITTEAATGADAIITGGATSDLFGWSLTAGDLNADGKIDLVVGAYGYNPGGASNTGRAYIFFGGSVTTETTTGADVTLTGNAASDQFGYALGVGDFDRTGTADLVVSAPGYTTNTGRAYVFYNDNSMPTTAATADITITGETTSNYFGFALTTGDFNADSTVDILVGAKGYNTGVGRAYIFYNDSAIPTAAGSADIIISGVSTDNFGYTVGAGDMNADGKTDLIVGAYTYSGGAGTGRAYIFYADGSNDFGRVTCTGSAPTACLAANADTILTGDSSSQFSEGGFAFGDWSGDGRVDMVVASPTASTNTGMITFYEGHENFSWQIQKQSQQTSTSAIRTGVNTSGQELQVTGEATSNFGYALASGDFNADGKTDLAVGANIITSSTGRVYLFYSDGSLTTGAASADVVIRGEATSNQFGVALGSGDMNSDGKTDLLVGALGYSSTTGRVYVFYNDGAYPNTAANADMFFTGETANDRFGEILRTADLDASGTTDLVVGSRAWNSSTGRAYVFYNDGSMPTTAATADATMSGETTSNSFGAGLTTGDFNADGKVDLAVGAWGYSTSTGRTYIFYNGSLTNENATGADVIITGGTTNDLFGIVLESGDFNADGKTDLAASARNYSSLLGRVYLFYNDGSIPTTVGTADVTIGGESTGSYFGGAMKAADFNQDGRTDLAVGAMLTSSTTGKAFIFYNDGSWPATGASADISFSGGEAASDAFGASLAAGDFNADGKVDLAVGAYGYSSTAGKVYVYTFGNDPIIAGGAANDYFGWSMTTGDWNADGKTDLAVGAYHYTTSTGRVYVFYNDGAYPSSANSADAIMTGEATSDKFGITLASGDMNTDGKADLIVGADGYSSTAGRVYIFYGGSITTETAAGADRIITGATNTGFGSTAIATGDFDYTGTTDLLVLATGGAKAYLFYNDNSMPTTAATADVTITAGSIPNSLAAGDFNSDGRVDFAIGDYWPAGGDFTGRVYIFNNDGSYPSSYTSADTTLSGEAASSYFGFSLAAGDFNNDGRTDLAVGAKGYNPGSASNTGRAYLFYNDGSMPTTAATADVTITGDAASGYFGWAIAPGDFNLDGRTDLAISAYLYSSNTGRVYIFNNDGSYPTSTSSADITLSGNSGDVFGTSLAVGDLNTDGKVDLAVGAYNASTSAGKTYVFSSEAAATATPPGTMYLKGTGKMKGTGKLK